MADVFLEPIPVAGNVTDVMSYLGEGWVPQDVRRRRKLVRDAVRRAGTPVVVKHMYNDQDVTEGRAVESSTFASAYGQVRHDDPMSYGVGFVSAELSPDEWYNADTGELVTAVSTPGAAWVQAPLYRGFGPGYLMWIIEPDVAEDMFKITDQGVLIKTRSATAQAPWYPEVNDNDLLVNITIDSKRQIIDTHERYQCKMSNPVSIRGHQRHGRREYTEDGGNRFVVNQTFEMALVPETDILYAVPIDR